MEGRLDGRALEAAWRVEPLEDGPAGEPFSLVEVVLAGVMGTPRGVRVRNRLSGPVLPPRYRGVPEPGWSRDGFEGVLDAGGRLALGYACPAPPADPPVAVEPDDSADAEPTAGTTPEAAVRALGPGRPPAAAVPADGSDAAPRPAAVRRRIERAERLDGASVSEATAVLGALDAGESVTALRERVAADARELGDASRLAARARAAAVPAAALRRLA